MSGIVSKFSSDKSGVVGADRAVKHTVMDADMNQSGHRNTSSTSPTNTGISGSFVTKYSSKVSFFVIHWHCSMFHVNSVATSQIKINIRSGGSSTTYDADSDLNANQYGWYFYSGVAGTHFPLDYYGVYKEGASTVVNMPSYTAGTVVDTRVFAEVSTGTTYFPHTNGMYILEATEYLRSRIQ